MVGGEFRDLGHRQFQVFSFRFQDYYLDCGWALRRNKTNQFRDLILVRV
ncbi:MAG: hypothetical protein ACFFG0_47100 [Candidatus Thorarchaeota archaeon]